jgi:phage gp16-like protein
MTGKQNKMIWVLAGQIGLDDEGLHELVRGATGKESLKGLSYAETAAVIEALRKAGARAKKKRQAKARLPENVTEIVTPEQRRMILFLEKKMGWETNPERLKGFSRRIIKRDAARTKREAQMLILALKNYHTVEEGKGPTNETQTGRNIGND